MPTRASITSPSSPSLTQPLAGGQDGPALDVRSVVSELGTGTIGIRGQ